MTAAHVFVITPARRLRWRTGALARSLASSVANLLTLCAAFGVYGARAAVASPAVVAVASAAGEG